MNMEHPWLPADIDDTFDPLEHSGVTISKETPMAITPRGGGREVGRSCYQVDTEYGCYLVDAGLNQGDGGQFPDLRGIDPGDIDALFLTHAHIDHCGGLPVLENRSLLAEDAPIIATRPTTRIARTLLEDSLKIHRREAQRPGHDQQFDESDLAAVYERFEPIDYMKSRVEDFAPVPDHEPLTFEYGNAGHLLGSAWIALQTNGFRTVFSGDLGGRATHLPDIAPPPEADCLILESTYGGRHSHTSMSDARTEVYRAIERGVKNREPVLIPTFAVGRAQTLLLLLKERLHQLPGTLDEDVNLILDGMAQEATELYHSHVTDEEYFTESIINRVQESGWTQPFLPEQTILPDGDENREQLLDEFDPVSGENIPVIIAPSGMLTGGNSPRYLAEFAARYDSATVLLTGYQAKGTTGRQLQNALKAESDRVTITEDINPISLDWGDHDGVTWTRDEDSSRVPRFSIPTDWISPVDGLSGHAAQHGLLDFVRDVGPDTIGLIHGPDYAQERLANHLIENVDVNEVTRTRLLTPLPVTRDPDIQTASLAPEMTDADEDTISDQLEHLHELMGVLGEELATTRQGQRSDEELRALVRDVVQEMAAEGDL